MNILKLQKISTRPSGVNKTAQFQILSKGISGIFLKRKPGAVTWKAGIGNHGQGIRKVQNRSMKYYCGDVHI
jgi:hypothetical protein